MKLNYAAPAANESTFIVDGADQNTGSNVQVKISATSEAEAIRKANEENGILVSSVKQETYETYDDWGNRCRTTDPKKAIAPALRPDLTTEQFLYCIAQNTAKTAFWVRLWSILAVTLAVISLVVSLTSAAVHR